MRDLRELEQYRDRLSEMRLYGSLDPEADQWGGSFRVKVRTSRRPLFIIASRGDHPMGLGWDHVSVSLPARCPTWEEMDLVKRLFFAADEIAMQLHVSDNAHISNHPYCLHIWRPVGVQLPTPPSILVGIKELGELPVRAA